MSVGPGERRKAVLRCWSKLLIAGGTGLLLAGCASLFPKSGAATEAMWKSYDEVQAAFDRIVPHETSVNELECLGFHPNVSPNVRLLTYVDIIQRFIPNPAITKDDLDEAVRACIEAREKSRAFELELNNVKSKRHGNLFLDMTSFKRQTHESGWQFKGLILIKDDVVVYKLSSGQPSVSKAEVKVRPLGPLQEIDGLFFRGLDAVR